MSTSIPGLTRFEGPRKSSLQPHKFSLPAGFDRTKFAARWEEEGLPVLDAANPEILAYAGLVAEGWKPWTVIDVEATAKQRKAKAQPEKPGEPVKELPEVPPVRVPFTRVVGKKKFVLLYRPIELQRAVNAIYGEESRSRVTMEVKGDKVSALQEHDDGVLGDNKIREKKLDPANDDDPAVMEYQRATRRIHESSDLNLASQLE